MPASLLAIIEVLAASYGEKEGAKYIAIMDFPGHSADKSKTGGWPAAELILGALHCCTNYD